MAGVDLYGGDAQRIRSQYQTSLGRDASDDEVTGWLSGSYGGGTTDDWLRQISGSHEAQQRNPQPQVPSFSAPPQQQNPGVNYAFDTGGAQADPMAQARQGLASTYQQFLGRSASDDELNNWLSGAYGYGGGLQNYDKYINAIMGSHEARNYRPPGTPQPGGYQNLEWWQQQGTPTIDIFDPTTGQLKPGWSRTARGYERTGGAAGAPGAPGGSSVPGPVGGDFQTWFMGLTGGRPPSPQSLEALAPILQQYGIRLGPKNARGFTDGIILPNGQFVDVITAATETGGTGWAWQTGGGSHGGPQAPGNQYSDPYTQFLEMLLKGRIGNLGQPVNDPYRQQYMDAMSRRSAALTAAEPDYQTLVGSMRNRVTDLRGPGYTGAENEAVRTGALDPIEQDRQAARQRVIERLAARGITLESGIAQQALNDVDKAFDGMRATTQTTLTTSDLQRREGRNQRADAMETGIYDIGQARSREQLDVFSAMQVLEGMMQAEQDAREREQLSIGGALADLGPQRLQLAMQAAGMGGNPSSNFSSLLGLAGLNQNAALLNQRNSGQLWSGIGQAAYYLSNAGR
jgi:hypothetical protein